MSNKFPQMTQLSRTFPMFAKSHMWPNDLWVGQGPKADAPGIEPWDAEKLAACAGAWSSGEQHVVRFLLTVFAGEADIDCYGLGRFDFIRAVGAWDISNIEAFTGWAKQPYWP